MKTFKWFCMSLLTAFLLTGCGDDEEKIPEDPVEPEKPEVPEDNTKPQISIPSDGENYFLKEMTFGNEADEITFAFITNVDWKITEAATRNGEKWYSVYPTSGKSGENLIRVKTTENTGYDDRSVVLTLDAGGLTKPIKVVQKQKDALTLTSSKFEVDAKGGKIDVEVKANVDYQVVIPENSKSWIKQETSRGLETSKLSFTIEPSNESEKREGAIIIQSGTLKETVQVFQSGEKVLVLNADTCVVSDKGDTLKVEIKSNFNYDVKMPAVDWITEDQTTRGVSSHTLYYVIKPNETYDAREAQVIFYDKDSSLADTLTVQQVQKDAILLSQKEYNVQTNGGVVEVKLSSNIAYDLDINVDWIKQAATRGLTEETLLFIVSPNDSTAARTGLITVTDKKKAISDTIRVNQAQKGGVTVTKKHYEVKAIADTIEVEVFANIELATRISRNWIQAVPATETRSMERHLLRFAVATNDTYSPRSAEIELYNDEEGISETITVAQEQNDAIQLAKKAVTARPEGQPLSVTYRSNVPCTVTTDSDWITEIQSRRLTQDLLMFQIAPNDSTETRTGRIIIANTEKKLADTLVVTQAPLHQQTPLEKVFGNTWIKGTTETDKLKQQMSYTNGWLTKVTESYSGTIQSETVEFDYSQYKNQGTGKAPQVRLKFTNSSINEIIMTIGANGFVESCTETYTDNSTVDTWQFKYNEEGQLTYMKRSEGQNEETFITYENGNIVKVRNISEDPTSPESNCSVSYTTSAIKEPLANTGKLMFFDNTFGIDLDEMEYAYWAGLLGNPTKNLPLKNVISTTAEDETVEMQWKLNSTNYPTALTLTGTYYTTPRTVEFEW